MSSSSSAIDKEDLIGICIDFFEAGGETVGSTLSWFILFMALHRDVQEKCAEEIGNSLGKFLPASKTPTGL